MRDFLEGLLWSTFASLVAAGGVLFVVALYAGPPLLLLAGALWILDLFGVLALFGGQ